MANEGFRFVNWTDAEGNVISESNPYVFEVTKDLDLTATLDAKAAYSDADFVVIAALTNVYSTNRIDVALPKRTCFVH